MKVLILSKQFVTCHVLTSQLLKWAPLRQLENQHLFSRYLWDRNGVTVETECIFFLFTRYTYYIGDLKHPIERDRCKEFQLFKRFSAACLVLQICKATHCSHLLNSDSLIIGRICPTTNCYTILQVQVKKGRMAYVPEASS